MMNMDKSFNLYIIIACNFLITYVVIHLVKVLMTCVLDNICGCHFN